MAGLIDLPIEIIQQIATHLPSCTDLLAFSLTARKIHSAVLATQAVCRELFLRTYDKPPSWEHYDYKRTYLWRQQVLSSFLDSPPSTLQPPITDNLLDGVKTIMFEARKKNFPHLTRFAAASRNLLPLFPDLSAAAPGLLMTLQLLLTNLAASRSITWADSAIESVQSQKWAYGDGSRALFEKDGIDGADLTRLWRTANFFLLHFMGQMKCEDEERGGLKMNGLKLEFERLVAEGQGAPGMWDVLGREEREEEEEEIPRYWFGFYVYLEPEDIYKLRTDTIMTPLQDHYDGRLSIMELDITGTTFTGTGSDIEPFTVKGAISPLPAISGIPGWRRISFSNNYPEDRWLYEGCLLPGSRTIVGRWTTFDEDEIEEELAASGWEGPFVMWSVAKEKYEYERGLRVEVGEEDDFLNY